MIRTICLDLFHLVAALIIGGCIACVTGLLFAMTALSYAVDDVTLWFGVGVVLALGAIVLLALYERRA